MDQRRVGQILKEAREQKKLKIKDVSKETHIAPKFIIALENEDYTQFPGETFAVGFLKNYSDFLKCDTESVLKLYKGEQIEESQVPLEELIKPTSTFTGFDKNKVFIGAGILIAMLSLYLIVQAFDDGGTKDKDGTQVIVKEKSEIPQDVAFISQSVPDNTSVPFILTSERGVSFSVNNQQCKIFIISVKEGKDGDNRATLGFNIFPEKRVYKFEIKTGDESVLSYTIPELNSLRRDIRIVTQAITGKSAKIMVTLSEGKEGASNKPVGDVPIQVTLYFLKSSYSEVILDGQVGDRGLVQAGEVRQLEARDRLEIKVGDGGAVEMVQNGKERIKLGKPGKLVKKVFYKIPNPYDSTQFIIKELGE